MRYWSDITKEFYQTEQACLDAENLYHKQIEEQEKLKQRKAREKKVEEARVEYLKAKKNYDEILKEFCKDYGSYTYSSMRDSHTKNSSDLSISEYLNALFGV